MSGNHYRRLLRSMVLALMCVTHPYCVFADPLDPPPQNAQRPCRGYDMVGKHFKLVYLDERPRRGEYMFYNEFPNHYLAFYPNFTYAFVGEFHEITDPLVLEKKLLWPLKSNHVLKFQLSPQGELIMYFDKNIYKIYSCVTITQTVGNFKVGDLILNGYTKKKRSKVYKLYRLWY